jgi:GNAT superfamily N-acetyltransferase
MTIVRLGIDDAPEVLDSMLALLRELGQEAEDLGPLDVERTMGGWRRLAERIHVFAARDAVGKIVGVVTVCEESAIYANGLLGVINEMYVTPSCRSQGVGKRLIDEAKALARELGWSRLDVTAPESARWERTRAFYTREGFTFAGPKLKYVF